MEEVAKFYERCPFCDGVLTEGHVCMPTHQVFDNKLPMSVQKKLKEHKEGKHEGD